MNKTIHIIGAGNVGQALAVSLDRSGHDVAFLVRDPASPKVSAALAKTEVPVEQLGSARARPVVILATPHAQSLAALQAAGDLSGSVIIDATNPLTPAPGGMGLAYGLGNSGAEDIARHGYTVIKCFNTVGAEVLANPKALTTMPAMLVAGDDPAAKRDVLQLVEDIGFVPVDAGPLKAARLLEAQAMLWIHLAFNTELGRNFAFSLTRSGSAA